MVTWHCLWPALPNGIRNNMLYETNNIDDFTSRIDTKLTLGQIIDQTAIAFHLGSIESFHVITSGYQDLNVYLKAKNGAFVLKIFSKEKSFSRITDLIWGYTTLRTREVPLPELVTTPEHDYLLPLPGNHNASYACLFRYFDGKPLTEESFSDQDLVTLTNAMATIHSETKQIERYYDTLGIMQAPGSYEKYKSALTTEEQDKLIPIIRELTSLDLTACRHSLIHGTMEKENILKDANGVICLLDLGCMDYNASILDIATFIANFTVDQESTKRDKTIQTILTTYETFHPISEVERTALPTLIRAQYAAYVIGMNHHQKVDHDQSKQTAMWLKRGWDGLQLYQGVTKQ